MKNIRQKNTIYLDNASATPIDPRVLKVLIKTSKEIYANPSAIHSLGVLAHEYLDKSRKKVADVLGAHADEIVFCSGGTESDNIAVMGIVNAFKKKFPKIKPHIIISSIEHAAVISSSEFLKKEGVSVSFLSVNNDGVVDLKQLRKLIKPETVLVSVMYANNEIGTVEPIREIAKEIRHFRKNSNSRFPFFHTDASQALNYLPISVEKLGVDLLSINSSKIYGPKGVGALFVKRNTPIDPIMFGGDQEYGLRPGTESLPNIVAFAEAVSIADAMRDKEVKRLKIIQDNFVKKLKSNFPQVVFNGSLTERLPNNVNISLSGNQSEMLVLYLDAEGICISSKSACKSIDPEASYVIRAIRGDKVKGDEGSLRFSAGRSTTSKDIDTVIVALKKIFSILKKK